MKILFSFLGGLLWILPIMGQTHEDTIFCGMALAPVTIDGQDTEACWEQAGWHAIDQVWIPYGAVMKAGDFSGWFKVAWDTAFLYLLVEVMDDMLSDDHIDPYTQWWDDDCLEIFVDENRSMGDHKRNCNAFAYHISLSFDALDLNAAGQGVNYKDHIEVDMDTIATDTYLWEVAIRLYDATYQSADPEASRVYPKAGMLMGLALAYCDNDATTTRENFIGSMYLSRATGDVMWRNADYFGPLLLVGTSLTGPVIRPEKPAVRVYPVPVRDLFTVEIASGNGSMQWLKIFNLHGHLVFTEAFQGSSHTLSLADLPPGSYLLQVDSAGESFIRMILKL
jgi:hypothetical protein